MDLENPTVIPNLFLVGAPKCGTTALSVYLGGHKDICFSRIKEPSYFASDFSEKFRRFSTFDEYSKTCFPNKSNEYKYFGEASTMYLYSREAVLNIIELNKDSRFVVMVRNPVDMMISYFYQLRYNGHETAASPEQAWLLQHERRLRVNWPYSVPDGQLLLYKDICSLGTQIERIKDVVPKGQVKIILFDDFAVNSRGVYEDLLQFLGLPYDGRMEFPVVNGRKTYRLSSIVRFVQEPPRIIEHALSRVYGLFGIRRLGLLEFMEKANMAALRREPEDLVFRRTLIDEFSEETNKLESILNRDLDSWRKVT